MREQCRSGRALNASRDGLFRRGRRAGDAEENESGVDNSTANHRRCDSAFGTWHQYPLPGLLRLLPMSGTRCLHSTTRGAFCSRNSAVTQGAERTAKSFSAPRTAKKQFPGRRRNKETISRRGAAAQRETKKAKRLPQTEPRNHKGKQETEMELERQECLSYRTGGQAEGVR